MSSSYSKRVLPAVAVAETITGAALLVDPVLVVHLLLGTIPDGPGVLVARFAGIALLGLSVACWPGPPLAGMLLYSTGVAIFLGCLPLQGVPGGMLLWPAARSMRFCRHSYHGWSTSGNRKD